MITILGKDIFGGCSSLTSVVLPPTVTTLGDCVFYGCCSLTSIVLPSTITTLGDYVFQGCTSLTSITLPPLITRVGKGVFGDCSLLTSLYLPENLIIISTRAVVGCSKLTTIKAPSFSTTSFEKYHGSLALKELLVESGFSLIEDTDIVFGQWSAYNSSYYYSQESSPNVDLYHDKKGWAKRRGIDGRLPLFTVAVKSINWACIRQIFIMNMAAIQEVDTLTGLPVFMLAAAGPWSDIESVYNLLREYPPAIDLSIDIHQS